MAEAGSSPLMAPRISALQRAWLREIGMDKVWLREEAAAPTVPAVLAVPAARVAADPAVEATLAAVNATAAPEPAINQAQSSATPSAAPTDPAAAPPSPFARAVALAKSPAKPDTAPAGGQPAVDLERLDIDGLREQVVGCTACGLCQGRRNAVFGAGAPQAKWLVVGEAPGEQEDRQGLPFVGRSGQLLDSMLGAVGMSREKDVFIANVIKCRPPGNRNPKPEEIAACSPYLMRQIALLKPERILVLGRFAAQALLGTDAPIGSLRGRLHVLKADGREIPVVVSYHPAYLLRSPGEKARSWQDLQLAAGA
jgi:uracil-DNA glycosylase family 4